MLIGGLQRSSLIDYPAKISAVIFTQGCNFKCGYCHNPKLTNYKGQVNSLLALYQFLKSRVGKLDAVVITGGEPTLQKDLADFISKIKKMGFLIKLDTNGTNPDVLKGLIKKNLLDYIAMDIKAPLEKYQKIAGVEVDAQKISESIKLIMNSNVEYEFRTTVIASQLGLKDFEKIGALINGAEKYYLQKFVPKEILNPFLTFEKTYSDDEFGPIIEILKNYIKEVKIR